MSFPPLAAMLWIVLSSEQFLRLLDARFAERPPRRLVRAATRGLGWLSRSLPRSRAVRVAVERVLAPGVAQVVAGLGPRFGFARPADEPHWQRLRESWQRRGLAAGAEPLSRFWRAVYSWLGVEGSAMPYRKTWRIEALDDRQCVERLYRRDESGAERPGCPWGMRGPRDGFACRSVMMGSRNLFEVLGDAEMRVDVGIPEMLAVEGRVARHLEEHPGDDAARIWSALEPELTQIFRASQPAEGDFFVAGRLRAETGAVLRELIATMARREKPAIFCQFRITPRG